MRILVIYYSRTGTTAKLARSIAEATGGELEALVDTVDRKGALGFVRSLGDAITRSGSKLAPLRVDPGLYDLVIIGTPDWGKSVSAPVRTFLRDYGPRLHAVAFFLTDGLTDHANVFRDMVKLSGHEAIATLGLPHDEVVSGNYAGALAAFVQRLPVRASAASVASMPASAEAHP